MKTHSIVLPAAAAVLLGVPMTASGQTRLLLADRTNDTIWLLFDANNNGVIDAPGEVTPFFRAGNAAGTPAALNPNTIGVRSDGLVIVGDQDDTRRGVFVLRDLNRNGDAMDAGESIFAAGPANASGVSLAFPTGVGFDSAGRIYVTNAGNGFGSDLICMLADLNGNGDFMDAGEIVPYVGDAATGFGPGNGPYSPQEIVFDGSVGYLRNSSTNLHGVWKFVDSNGNGRADDPGEFTLVFGAGNLSGVTVSAGFAIDLDRAHPGSLYFHQLGASSADQIYRLTDLNHDGDFMDEGEAVLVFQTTEANFVSIDVLSLPDGTVLFSENSSSTTKVGSIIALRDNDGDGLFTSAGERTNFFVAAVGGQVGAVRAIANYPVRCLADVVGIGGVPVADGLVTGDDFIAYINAFSTGDLLADIVGIGGLPPPDALVTGDDFNAFINNFAAGCP